MEDWTHWIGRTETEHEILSPAPIARLSALLDLTQDHGPSTTAPPLSHWLYFLPRERQSDIDVDGHPKRGGFLPPIPLPRRMWAGSRISFEVPLTVGATMERRSTIRSIALKQGTSGPLVFVTVEREVRVDGDLAVREKQDLVFRGPSPPPAPTTLLPPAATTRRIVPDPALLFRFSALTFNAHRIHYDRDYARDVEGYSGLVVHAPLQALMLMHFFRADAPGVDVAHFTFRAQRPLIDTEPFDLCLEPREDGATVSTRSVDGQAGMLGEIRTR